MKIYLLFVVVVLCVSLCADVTDGNPQHHKKGVFHRLKHMFKNGFFGNVLGYHAHKELSEPKHLNRRQDLSNQTVVNTTNVDGQNANATVVTNSTVVDANTTANANTGTVTVNTTDVNAGNGGDNSTVVDVVDQVDNSTTVDTGDNSTVVDTGNGGDNSTVVDIVDTGDNSTVVDTGNGGDNNTVVDIVDTGDNTTTVDTGDNTTVVDTGNKGSNTTDVDTGNKGSNATDVDKGKQGSNTTDVDTGDKGGKNATSEKGKGGKGNCNATEEGTAGTGCGGTVYVPPCCQDPSTTDVQGGRNASGNQNGGNCQTYLCKVTTDVTGAGSSNAVVQVTPYGKNTLPSATYPSWPNDFDVSGSVPETCNCGSCACGCVEVPTPVPNNNHLCYKKSQNDPNIEWSHKGPIKGKRCIHAANPSFGRNWYRNFLCVPRNSPYHFAWSIGKPMNSKLFSCLKMEINQRRRKHNDNYLCARRI